MSKSIKSGFVSGSSLNTLAYNGTASFNTLAQTGTAYIKPTAIISGVGSKMDSDKALKGKAKRKVISRKLTLKLATIAKGKQDEKYYQSFWNTFHCQNRVITFEGRIYGRYCKNRFCTLCSNIRRADIINRYLPVMQEWEEPYFLTLTIRACKAARLRVMFAALIRAIKRITAKYRKRNQRGKDIKLIGIKSLECNFNHEKRTYNPHLHLIVANKAIGDIILKEWLLLWTPKFAGRAAQDIRPVEDIEQNLIEVIKYGSKIFREPDMQNRAMKREESTMYVAALYNIFDAMKGLRIFDRFGFDLPKEAKERIGARVVNDFYDWVFSPENFDWLNTENELTLTGYTPSNALRNILENNIDMRAE